MPNSHEELLDLIAAVDIRGLSRKEWRALCRGTERARVQKYLLDMAHAAETGTQADRLALYQGAYAVLPLHGAELLELAKLLCQTKTDSLDWADALIEAFALKPPGDAPLFSSIREALSRILAIEPSSPAAQRIHDWVLYHQRQLDGSAKPSDSLTAQAQNDSL